MYVNILNKSVVADKGKYMSAFEFHSARCTGKSLATAMLCVSQAILSPLSKVYINDHAGTRQANRHTLMLAKGVIARQQLRGIKCVEDHKGCYVVFDPLVPLEDLLDAYKNKA